MTLYTCPLLTVCPPVPHSYPCPYPGLWWTGECIYSQDRHNTGLIISAHIVSIVYIRNSVATISYFNLTYLTNAHTISLHRYVCVRCWLVYVCVVCARVCVLCVCLILRIAIASEGAGQECTITIILCSLSTETSVSPAIMHYLGQNSLRDISLF